MQPVAIDWDTIREILRCASQDRPVGMAELAEQVGYRMGRAPDDPAVRERILAQTNELALNGFLHAPYPFASDSRIESFKPMGLELHQWMADDDKWGRLKPGLEEALRSGLGAEGSHLSSKVMDSALRQAGER